MSRKNTLSVDEFYHIFNRGTDKRTIFINESDYVRFIVLMYIANNPEPVFLQKFNEKNKNIKDVLSIHKKETLVDIGAYCLMPNHFHILVREKVENGTSLFMKKLCTGYSMYFNKKHQRTGTLFQGPFKSEHVTDDIHLKYLFAYIHLNPIKIIDTTWKEVGLKNLNETRIFLKKYQYSSYLDYLEQERVEKKILNREVFPEYFSNNKSFEYFLEEWLMFKEKEDL